MNDYADALESYIIDDAANEGFIGKTIKILGVSILAITALPFVMIGGIAWVGGMEISRECRKVKKELKAQASKNNGKISDYGKNTDIVFKYYKKDIIKIQEPVQLQKLIPVFNQAGSFCKEVDTLRKEFADILKKDPCDQKNCEKLLYKFKALYKKIDEYYNKNKTLYQIDNSSEKKIVDINNSALINLENIAESVENILYFNENSIPENWVYKYIWYDDNYWDNTDDNKTQREIEGIFGDIYHKILDIIKWEQFIENCKFALNPKLKSKY